VAIAYTATAAAATAIVIVITHAVANAAVCHMFSDEKIAGLQ
jgi:hypothetical protein